MYLHLSIHLNYICSTFSPKYVIFSRIIFLLSHELLNISFSTSLLTVNYQFLYIRIHFYFASHWQLFSFNTFNMLFQCLSVSIIFAGESALSFIVVPLTWWFSPTSPLSHHDYFWEFCLSLFLNNLLWCTYALYSLYLLDLNFTGFLEKIFSHYLFKYYFSSRSPVLWGDYI